MVLTVMTTKWNERKRINNNTDVPSIACLVEPFFVHLCNRFNGEQDNHGVRGAPTVVGRKTSKEANRSFLLGNLHGTIHDALVRQFAGHGIGLLRHEATLDQIKGETEQGRGKAGRGRRAQLGRQRWFAVRQGVAQQSRHNFLGLIVTRQHADVLTMSDSDWFDTSPNHWGTREG
jgi:hypothetical protein